MESNVCLVCCRENMKKPALNGRAAQQQLAQFLLRNEQRICTSPLWDDYFKKVGDFFQPGGKTIWFHCFIAMGSHGEPYK